MSKAVEDFQKNIEKTVQLEAMKEENAAKKALLDSKRLDNALARISSNEEELKKIQEANFDGLSSEEVAKIQKDNDEYLIAAKSGLMFISKDFNNIVPFFRKNLILIGGVSGHGKSTTVANIAYEVMRQISPVTGKPCRVLVITNEERREDFYNRVTCLGRGWHYTNHSEFTDEQRKFFTQSIAALAKRLVVIDNTHNGSLGVTTTLEGIEAIFENLIANNIHYDVIIIDYYQNIVRSKKDPMANEWAVQSSLAKLLDDYKNRYSAPIVLMSQLNPQDKDGKIPFQNRIKGRKNIMDVVTFALEMERDVKNLRTLWCVHKSRYTAFINHKFKTGYKNGRFVAYDDAFIAWATRVNVEKASRSMNLQSGQDLKERQEELKNGTNA